jgi:uncharacterized OB-fold protein
MDVDWANGVPLMVGPFQIGHAEPSPETAGYWEGVKAGRLMIKRCARCGLHHHPRRLFCLTTGCGSDAFDWVEAQGTGSVYTFSTVHRAPSEEFAAEVPYTVGVLELAEGVFFFSRILPRADGEAIRIGAPVRLEFREVGRFGRLPAFRVAG